MANPIAELRSLAQHIDPQFHVALNDVPAVLSALILKGSLGDELAAAIEAGQEIQRDLHPAEVQGNEVRTSVAHLIEPPLDPQTQALSGVSNAEAQALRTELAAMRDQLERLTKFVPVETPSPAPVVADPAGVVAPSPPVAEPAPAPADTPEQPSPRELELRAEVEQLQYALAQRQTSEAAGSGHPTVEHEPGADEPSS